MFYFPEWLMGLCVGVISIWLGSKFKSHLDRRGKIINKYSEFFSLAVMDSDRAKRFLAQVFNIRSEPIGGMHQESLKTIRELEDERHKNRIQINQIALQIQILEYSPELCSAIDVIAEIQPYIQLQGWNSMNAGMKKEIYDEFRKEVNEYSDRINALAVLVRAQYKPKWFE